MSDNPLTLIRANLTGGVAMYEPGERRIIQQIIDSDLSTDERAVLITFVIDTYRPGSNGVEFRWKKIGDMTGFRKKEVLAIHNRLVQGGWLQPVPRGLFGQHYEIPHERIAS